MAWTPLYQGFNYIKNQPIPTPVTVSYKPTKSNTFDHEIISVPQWLEAYDGYYDGTDDRYYVTLRVKESYAINMVAGTYNDDIYLRYKYTLSGQTYTENSFQFGTTTYIEDFSLLSINPTVMSFSHVIGATTPQGLPLQIQSQSNWNITSSQSWCIPSSASGSGNGTITINVDPSGLGVGNYSAVVTVTDANSSSTVNVGIAVTETTGEFNFLYITPQNMLFVAEYDVASTQEITLYLETSHAWTSTIVGASWLNLSTNSGAAGNYEITVTVDNTTGPLAIGEYTGSVEFNANGILKTLYITLRILEFSVTGITNETLYFAEDRNKLQVVNTEPNTFLTLDVLAANTTENVVYTQEAPYFQGVASIVIGEETNNLLKSVIPTNSFTSRIKNNITPVNIGFTVYDKNKNIDSVAQVAQFANLLFLTGNTPVTANKLSYIPDTVYLTKNAVLSLSVLSDANPASIYITGDVTQTISTSLGNDLKVYNAILNLADLSLSIGNSITVTFGDITVNVIIKKEAVEQNIIAFENEWREYEFFETTGFFTVLKTSEKTISNTQVENTKHSKVVNIENGVEYYLNTGWIYTQEETDWLAKILESKRVFLYQNNEPVEIILETKNLEVYQTRNNLKSFNIKFSKAIN